MTDERLLLSCCSDVAEWLVTAADADSTVVTIPDGTFLASRSVAEVGVYGEGIVKLVLSLLWAVS